MKRIRLSATFADGTLRAIAINDGLGEGQRAIVDAALTFCLLKDKHLLGVAFSGGRVRHCRLEFVNLRDASFDRVDLTGTTFTQCNLRHARFVNCNLRYVNFNQCQLDYGAVLESAPNEPNLRQELLRSLRCNALSMGDSRQAEQLLAQELVAEREELWNRIVVRTEHYRKRSSGWDRIVAGRDWLGWWVSHLFWGHGLALGRIPTSGAFVVATFAALCVALPAHYRFEGAAGARALTFSEALYYSAMSFTTGGFGDIMPGNEVARVITSVEGLIGVVFLGFFAAAAYRRLAR